jgi:CRP-like cAMP-binding protein
MLLLKVIPKLQNVKELLMEAVSKNILFSSFSTDEHNAIIDAHECVQFEPGEFVIKQGDQGNDFFIVESGCLDVCFKTSYGETKVSSSLGPGSSFGELALMYNTPRAASIKATTPCVLWKIHRDIYREIIIFYKYMRNKTHLEFLAEVRVLDKRLGDYLDQG